MISSLLFVVLILSTSMPIFADSIWKTDAYDLTDYAQKISSYYAMARNIVCALCAVGIAWTGLGMIHGTEEDMRKGKGRIKYMIVAMVAVFFVPYCIRFGMELGKTYAWKPPQ